MSLEKGHSMILIEPSYFGILKSMRANVADDLETTDGGEERSCTLRTSPMSLQ